MEFTLDEVQIGEIVTMLDKARSILVANDPALITDMEVSEWNETPLGQVSYLIGEVIDLLMELE